jgi:hypothetical protein
MRRKYKIAIRLVQKHSSQQQTRLNIQWNPQDIELVNEQYSRNFADMCIQLRFVALNGGVG